MLDTSDSEIEYWISDNDDDFPPGDSYLEQNTDEERWVDLDFRQGTSDYLCISAYMKIILLFITNLGKNI